jgi:PAS domain-containing protein
MPYDPQLPPDGASTASTGLWPDPLSLLLESTGEGIFGIDMDGNCTFINRAGAGMLGWDPADVLHRNMHELTHHSHPDGRHYPVDDCPIFNAFREARPAASTPRCSGAVMDRPSPWSIPATRSWTEQRCAVRS